MRRIYLALCTFLVFISISVSGQDLANSRRSSYYTFIYKISNEQAKVLYNDIWDLDTTFLHNLFDSYPTDSAYKKKLPVGHFVFVKTVNEDLSCTLQSVNNLNMSLLNNHRDLVMVFNDSLGRELHDLKVEVRSKRIPFQKSIKAYRLKKSNKKGIVSAQYQGHVSYFEIDRSYNNTFFVRTGRKISQTFPVNHIISPVFYIKDNVSRIIYGDRLIAPGIYHRVARIFKPKAHSGYLVFNKPIFRPNDTLRLKGFVTTRKAKPIRKAVDVYLNKYYPDPFSKKIGTVTPFRKGGYQFEIRLSDSLNLKLDESYSVELRDKKGNALLSSRFRYEEYELKKNTYSVRSERKTKLKPATLYLKGEDSNEMPLFDVRVDILLKPRNVKKYYQPEVFVPDTLWFYQTKLDPIGETKINIPDSVMPAVSFGYEAAVAFYNAENERTVKTVSLDHDTQPFPIKIEIENDSLKVTNLDPQKPATGNIMLTRFIEPHNFTEKQISLPHWEKVDPFANTYSVAHSINNTIEREEIVLRDIPDQLQILSNRTSDSLIIATENPKKVTFRYFLFRNKKLIESAETESLVIKRKAKASDGYTLSVQYIWAGKPQTREYEIRFDRNNLDIKLDHPGVVYPGQKASFKITVADAFGKPVENADLTAYAITKKFETSSTPAVPDFSKEKPGRTTFNEFNTKATSLHVSKFLDWAFWKKTLGLDSIAFYKFLFPQNGYAEYRIKAEVSQFAPFVVSHGNVTPIRVIYVDGQPVYCEGTGAAEPYSFHISAGEHTVTLRLNISLVTIRNVKIEPGQKLIFSLDYINLPANCTKTEMPYYFNGDELRKLSRYFMVVRSQLQPDAYLQQGNIYRLIGSRSTYGYPSREWFLGPFYPGKTTYAQKDGLQLTFDYEPFSSYEFKPGLLKLRQADIGNYMKNISTWNRDIPSFKDQVQTANAIKKYWESLDQNTTVPFKRFPSFDYTSKHIGRLTLDGVPKEASKLFVTAAFVIDLDNPDNYFIFPNGVNNLPCYPGNYQATLIFNNEQYIKVDSIEIKPHGNNYYNLESHVLHKPDTFSSQVLKTIRKWSTDENYMMRDRQQELQKVRELLYQESSANYSFDHVVTGRIVSDEDGSPLPGVNVVVRGTSIGTVSDMNGYYRLGCPPNATLVFSFIGLVTQEAQVKSQGNLDVRLQNDVASLEEVVVVGYGLQTVRRYRSPGAQLSGRVPGVVVRTPRYRHDLEDSVAVAIRGQNSMQPEADPLVILDGKIVRLQDVDRSLVTAVEVLRSAEATAIYGSRGSNGVILLSTRPGIRKSDLRQISKSAITVAALEDVPGNSLRKNFRDYAFWKPVLRTDQDGHAEFEATFPDDITGWNAYVLGIANKRTGQTGSTIKSYKPLLAQIAQPFFLIQGDSSTAIGKITNYAQEEIQLDRTIKINEKEISRSSFGVKDSRIDTIQLNATGADSLAVYYSVSYKDYSDGELRNVPVYPRGTKEATGHFISLTSDTTVTLSFDNRLGKIKLYAQADVLDVLLDEINFLKSYPYECNEQLASRLWALLLEKKISTYKRENFKSEREILKTIRKLVSHQNKDGSWSWWSTGEGNIWITLHVAKSLDLAQREGFPVAINKQSLINFLEMNLADVDSPSRLKAQAYLMEQGEKLLVKSLVDSVQKSKTFSLHDKLTAQRLKQLSGEAPDWKWIHEQKSRTIKGNPYWGEERFDLSDNAVLNTLLVYKMMEKENPANKELIKIRNYFLEKRKRHWLNTYESSLIVEAILPGVLADKQSSSKAGLQLSGLLNQKIEKFPFEQTITGREALTISKSGQAPIYFTAYQEHWNTNPERSEKDFVVSTYFEDAPKSLKTGKPVKLTVKVEVKNDAEYVMIEVPIPAGCSYESKPQTRANGEVHREYYNHKTNLYCQYLKKGTYVYTIPLLPRYSGRYTINPAVAECMYFPVIYGRDSIKRVVIDRLK